MKSSTILYRAADLIEKEGWARGHMTGPRGGYCMLGAMRVAETGSPYDSSPEVRKAIKALHLESVTRWNDRHSKDDVLRKLRRTARRLRWTLR